MDALQIGRFFAQVEIADPADCWIWTGFRDRDGYGRFSAAGAHRVTYEMLIGPIPDGLTLDHLCRDRACVNPWHLEPVTSVENFLRAAAIRTKCSKGHEISEDNTRMSRLGRRGEPVRTCRTCERERQRRYARSKRSA
jgi:hypothetical protein